MAEYAKPSRAVNTVVAGAIILPMEGLPRRAPLEVPFGVLAAMLVLASPRAAHADGAALAWPSEVETSEAVAPPTAPPPTNINYIQYGVSFTGEFVAAPGHICANAGTAGNAPCIFGSGGGVAIRVGYRSAGPWYFGGAYELSKQDPNQLYRLAILQQLRGETRYYFPTGWDTSPFVSGGLGVAVYGNEGAIDTVAPSIFAAVGAETQLSRRMVVGVALAYRLLYFTAFTDSSGTARSAGLAQVVGLDLSLEARDPR